MHTMYMYIVHEHAFLSSLKLFLSLFIMYMQSPVMLEEMMGWEVCVWCGECGCVMFMYGVTVIVPGHATTQVALQYS